MRMVFTENETKEIVLAHVRRAYGASLDEVEFHSYKHDFCVVNKKEVEGVETHTKAIDEGDPFKDL